MTIDLEALKQKKALEDLEAERAHDAKNVTTAFLVVQDSTGQWTALAEWEDIEFQLERQAILDDMVGGCQAVLQGCQAQQNAIATAMFMEQRAAFMQQQMRAQAESQKIASMLTPEMLRSK